MGAQGKNPMGSITTTCVLLQGLLGTGKTDRIGTPTGGPGATIDVLQHVVGGHPRVAQLRGPAIDGFCAIDAFFNNGSGRCWTVTPWFYETELKPPYVCPVCSNHTHNEQYGEHIQYLVKLQAKILQNDPWVSKKITK
jgi:hypothetical protein